MLTNVAKKNHLFLFLFISCHDTRTYYNRTHTKTSICLD